MTAAHRTTSVIVVLLLAVTAGACSSQQRSGTHGRWPVMPYHGRLSDHARFPALVAELSDALEPSARHVSEALGLPVAATQYRYGFRVRSAPNDLLRARTLVVNAGTPARLEFTIEPLLFGQVTVSELLAHELVHAVMSRKLGARHEEVPIWLREGIAVHVAGQAESKIGAALAWNDREASIEIIDGLHPTRHSWSDYAEDALAVAFLLDRAGPDGIPRLVEALRRGEGWETAVAESTGLPADSFLAEAAEHGRREIARRVGDLEPSFQLGRRLVAAGDCEQALEALQPSLDAAAHAFHPAARFHAAGCELALGRPQLAEAHLSALLDGHRRELAPLAEALFGSAEAREQLGDPAGVRQRCSELLEHDPFDAARTDWCSTRMAAGRATDSPDPT